MLQLARLAVRRSCLILGGVLLGGVVGASSARAAGSSLVVSVAGSAGFSLVEQFVGHAIGREMHEPPQVPNFYDGKASEDFEIRPGLVLAIEPMLNAGSAGVRILDDHWTAVTEDGRPSVHFEHTIAVTADGPRLITAGVGGLAGMLGFVEF